MESQVARVVNELTDCGICDAVSFVAHYQASVNNFAAVGYNEKTIARMLIRMAMKEAAELMSKV